MCQEYLSSTTALGGAISEEQDKEQNGGASGWWTLDTDVSRNEPRVTMEIWVGRTQGDDDTIDDETQKNITQIANIFPPSLPQRDVYTVRAF